MNHKTASGYATERTNMVSSITQALSNDERVVAAWLIGSLARGDEDEFSDVDLCVVVSDTHNDVIANWLPFVSAFGSVANLHETQQNAPTGGTMASTLYTNGVTIDWMLIPQLVATRPHDAKMLLEKESIPSEREAGTLTPEEKQAQLSDRLTFFWMMAAVAAKSVLRNDAVRFHVFLNTLFWTVEEIKELMSERPLPYRKYSNLSVAPTREEQTQALVEICMQVAEISPNEDEQAFSVVKDLLDLRKA